MEFDSEICVICGGFGPCENGDCEDVVRYVVYTSPVRVVEDLDEARRIAEQFFADTGILVAVERGS